MMSRSGGSVRLAILLLTLFPLVVEASDAVPIEGFRPILQEEKEDPKEEAPAEPAPDPAEPAEEPAEPAPEPSEPAEPAPEPAEPAAEPAPEPAKTPPPSKGTDLRKARKPWRIGLRGGGLVPFLAREADFTAGAMVDLFGRYGDLIRIQRMPIDLEFALGGRWTSSTDQEWSVRSTLAISKFTGLLTFLPGEFLDVHASLGLGLGYETARGTRDTTWGEESRIQTGFGFLVSLGVGCSLRITDYLRGEAKVEINFAPGSKNVQGYVMGTIGVMFLF
ncbi:MAG: hypothetical protein ACYTHM_01655 [Planctomycetota bacterium]